MIYSQYVLLDRANGLKYVFNASDGEVSWTTTALSANPEPIVRDRANPSNYWRIFVSDGEIGWESTVTVQDDDVTLQDVPGNTFFKFAVTDGEFYPLETPFRLLVSRVNVYYTVANRLLICRVTNSRTPGGNCYVTVLKKSTKSLISRVFAQTLNKFALLSRVTVRNKLSRTLIVRVSPFRRAFRSLWNGLIVLKKTTKTLIVRVNPLKKTTKSLTTRLTVRNKSSRQIILRLSVKVRKPTSLVVRIFVVRETPAVGELKTRVFVLRKSLVYLLSNVIITRTRTFLSLLSKLTILNLSSKLLTARLTINRPISNRVLPCIVEVSTYQSDVNNFKCSVDIVYIQDSTGLSCSVSAITTNRSALACKILVTPLFTGTYTVDSRVWPSISLKSDCQRFGGWI